MASKGRRAPLIAGEGKRIEVGSGYGYNTKLPFVDLVVGTETIQLTAEKAREIAAWLFAAAEAAEGDGFVVEWMGDSANLTSEQAARLLNDFRVFRDRKRQEQRAHNAPPPAETA